MHGTTLPQEIPLVVHDLRPALLAAIERGGFPLVRSDILPYRLQLTPYSVVPDRGGPGLLLFLVEPLLPPAEESVKTGG